MSGLSKSSKPVFQKIEKQEFPHTLFEVFKTPGKKNQYKAVGLVRGIFIPSTEKNNSGRLLITSSKSSLEVKISPAFASWLKKHPEEVEKIQKEASWLSVWVRGNKDSSVIFCLNGLIDRPSSLEHSSLFHLRGNLVAWDKEKKQYIFQFKRNEEPPKKIRETSAYLWKPWTVAVFGELEGELKKGQFWELVVSLAGDRLQIKESSLLLAPFKKKKRTHSRNLGKRKNQISISSKKNNETIQQEKAVTVII